MSKAILIQKTPETATCCAWWVVSVDQKEDFTVSEHDSRLEGQDTPEDIVATLIDLACLEWYPEPSKMFRNVTVGMLPPRKLPNGRFTYDYCGVML